MSNRLVSIAGVALMVAGMAAVAHAADDEQVTLTGFIPAPQGIFNRLVFEQAWDYNAGSLSYNSAADWYVNPSGFTVTGPPWGDDLVSARLRGTMRAARFIDVDDLNYFLDPAEEFFSLRTAGAAVMDNVWVGHAPAVPPGYGGLIVHRAGVFTDGQYALAQSEDKTSTLLNKGAGAGRVALQIGGTDYLSLQNDRRVRLGDGGFIAPPRNAPTHAPNAELMLSNDADVAARDYWVDVLGRWVSEIGDASAPGPTGGGDGDWQIDRVGRMYNLNTGQFVRIGPGPGFEAAPGAPPAAKTVDVNGELVVRDPHGITLGGVRRTTWPTGTLREQTVHGQMHCGKGQYKEKDVTCPAGWILSGCSHLVSSWSMDQPPRRSGTVIIANGCRGIVQTNPGEQSDFDFWAHCISIQ